MTGQEIRLQWAAPGPVAQAFYEDDRFVTGIQGPIGSGKTTGVQFKLLKRARRQRPSTLDGVRKYKVCVIHQTYRQLWRGLIPSWFKWLPQSMGEWTGGKDGPARHEIHLQLGDGTRCQFIADFVAIGDNRAEDVLRGYEVTDFWLNEADLLDEEVFIYVVGRAGRYPGMNEGGPSVYGIQADFNAPQEGSWIIDKIIDAEHGKFGYHRQPGAREPGAENMANLVAGYYENQLIGQEDWYIHRMIDNKIGFSRDGKPVYPEYNEGVHCTGEELLPDRGLPLKFGFDAGGKPAGVIFQTRPNGQRRILDEILVEGGFCGPNRFGDEVNNVLQERYQGLPLGPGGADPSAMYGADKEAGEKNWIQAVRAKTGIKIRAAQTNELNIRLDAVRIPLTRLIDGHHPGLLVSSRCKTLRWGFMSGFRYRKVQLPGEKRFSETPDKNAASHPHDALQYGVMIDGMYEEAMGRRGRSFDATKQTRAIDEDGPSPADAGYGRAGGHRATPGRFRNPEGGGFDQAYAIEED